MSFYRNMAFCEKHVPHAQQILGMLFIRPATRREDTREATDLVVMESGSLQIGLRIRTPMHGGSRHYANEFTVRCKVANGFDTELDKIAAGHMRYMLYGFSDDGKGQIGLWRCLNMNVFRRQIFAVSQQQPPKAIGYEIENDDKWSSFRVYQLGQFPPSLVVASGYGTKVDFIKLQAA